LKKAARILILLCICSASVAGPQTDSLESVVRTAKEDLQKFRALRKLVNIYMERDPARARLYVNALDLLSRTSHDSLGIALAKVASGEYFKAVADADSSISAYEQAAAILERIGQQKELSETYTALGGVCMENGRYRQAVKWLGKATELDLLLKDEEKEANDLTYAGMSFNQMGDRPRGIALLQKALALAQKNNRRRRIGNIYLFIGSAYSESANQEYALSYFEKGQRIALEEKDTLLLLEADMYIGNNHYYKKRYEKAIERYEEVEIISLKKKDMRLYAGALGNLGNVYADMGQFDRALSYQNKAIPIFIEEGDNQGLVICYSAIGHCYLMLKKYSDALVYYEKGLKIAEAMYSMEDLIEIHEGLANTYEGLGDYKSAYQHFKSYKQFNDSIYNQGNTKKMTELEMTFRFESQQKEQELVQKNKEVLADEKLKRQKLLSYSSIAGVLLLLLIVGIVFRGSRQRKLANLKLQAFNEEITEQKEVIEHKNKEITDSINYAKRIQESILPLKAEIQQTFLQSFVLFKPRDVVSGDFYWFNSQNGKNIIACVDCTGHGVPGAFMSMIGNTLLNEIINERGVTSPAGILGLLHERVRQSLKQDLKNSETRDGMDVSVCVFNKEFTQMEFAGANRAVYIVRKGVLEELKPDKQAIGGDQIEQDRIFTNHKIDLEKGDTIYMSTDGYADQFGGEKGKKFMVRRFHQTLLEMQHLTMDEQGQLLKRIIEKWQGKIEQVDDILVIGIRV
jgi:serine phosphatase RsbU (regulator of sigma subunit)